MLKDDILRQLSGASQKQCGGAGGSPAGKDLILVSTEFHRRGRLFVDAFRKFRRMVSPDFLIFPLVVTATTSGVVRIDKKNKNNRGDLPADAVDEGRRFK